MSMQQITRLLTRLTVLWSWAVRKQPTWAAECQPWLYHESILPKGPYLPCLRMTDRALLAGYPRSALYQRIQSGRRESYELHLRVRALSPAVILAKQNHITTLLYVLVKCWHKGNYAPISIMSLRNLCKWVQEYVTHCCHNQRQTGNQTERKYGYILSIEMDCFSHRNRDISVVLSFNHRRVYISFSPSFHRIWSGDHSQILTHSNLT